MENILRKRVTKTNNSFRAQNMMCELLLKITNNYPVVDGFDNMKKLNGKKTEINNLVSDILNDSSIGLLTKSTINVLNLNKIDKLSEVDDLKSDLDSIDSDLDSIDSNYSFTLDK